jgi:hypothetical protein
MRLGYSDAVVTGFKTTVARERDDNSVLLDFKGEA